MFLEEKEGDFGASLCWGQMIYVKKVNFWKSESIWRGDSVKTNFIGLILLSKKRGHHFHDKHNHSHVGNNH